MFASLLYDFSIKKGRNVLHFRQPKIDNIYFALVFDICISLFVLRVIKQ